MAKPKKMVTNLTPRPKDLPVPTAVKREIKILEKHSETRLVKGIKSRGGECFKFSSMNRKGVSDRIVMIYGFTFFVEMKKEGITTPSPTQKVFRDACKTQGAYYCIVSGHDGVDSFLEFVDSKQTFFGNIRKFINFLMPLFDKRVFK